MPTTQILVASQVRRMIRRLAYEIVERNRGAENLVVLGILNTGAEVGKMISDAIGEIESCSVPFWPLDVTAFRDDLDPGTSAPRGQSPDLDLGDRNVILVDDVLFTGRTARAALDKVVSLGRPRSIQLTVLVDRGHREYPIQADFLGRRIPTKHTERVQVTVGAEPTVDVIE